MICGILQSKILSTTFGRILVEQFEVDDLTLTGLMRRTRNTLILLYLYRHSVFVRNASLFSAMRQSLLLFDDMNAKRHCKHSTICKKRSSLYIGTGTTKFQRQDGKRSSRPVSINKMLYNFTVVAIWMSMTLQGNDCRPHASRDNIDTYNEQKHRPCNEKGDAVAKQDNTVLATVLQRKRLETALVLLHHTYGLLLSSTITFPRKQHAISHTNDTPFRFSPPSMTHRFVCG
jgi:hypothetical protein